MDWFEQMMRQMGHRLRLGDAAAIRAAMTRRQKTDKRDAEHILKRLLEERFPRISAGGMSMKTDIRLAKEQPVEVTFSLPPKGKMVVARATVCWKRDTDDMIGIRFDPTDERRLEVKSWIDSYLETG